MIAALPKKKHQSVNSSEGRRRLFYCFSFQLCTQCKPFSEFSTFLNASAYLMDSAVITLNKNRKNKKMYYSDIQDIRYVPRISPLIFS